MKNPTAYPTLDEQLIALIRRHALEHNPKQEVGLDPDDCIALIAHIDRLRIDRDTKAKSAKDGFEKYYKSESTLKQMSRRLFRMQESYRRQEEENATLKQLLAAAGISYVVEAPAPAPVATGSTALLSPMEEMRFSRSR
jgi:hypothetical protein